MASGGEGAREGVPKWLHILHQRGSVARPDRGSVRASRKDSLLRNDNSKVKERICIISKMNARNTEFSPVDRQGRGRREWRTNGGHLPALLKVFRVDAPNQGWGQSLELASHPIFFGIQLDPRLYWVVPPRKFSTLNPHDPGFHLGPGPMAGISPVIITNNAIIVPKKTWIT